MNIVRYSTTEVCEALGIKYGRFREWIDRGYITATRRAEGSGDRTLFSRRDVYLVALFNYLIVVEQFEREVAGAWVQGVKNYLNAARTWDQVSENAFLILNRKRENLDGQKFKSVLALMAESRQNSKAQVSVVSESMMRDRSIYDVLSYKGFYERWDDFESLTIVNFRKIRELVDSKLG
jgi:excisionase family DNA binding protein